MSDMYRCSYCRKNIEGVLGPHECPGVLPPLDAEQLADDLATTRLLAGNQLRINTHRISQLEAQLKAADELAEVLKLSVCHGCFTAGSECICKRKKLALTAYRKARNG